MASQAYADGRHKTPAAISNETNKEMGSLFCRLVGKDTDGKLIAVANEGTDNERRVVLAQVVPHPLPDDAVPGQLALVLSETEGGIDPETNEERPNAASLVLGLIGSRVDVMKVDGRNKSKNTASSTYLHRLITSSMGLEHIKLDGEICNITGNDGVEGYEHMERVYTSPLLTSELIETMPKTQTCVCGCKDHIRSKYGSSKKSSTEDDGLGGEEIGVNLEEEHMKEA